jgi:NAD(P)-dependent dehydrogenase (short-subunit alcohol dehydrogenase family)
MVLGHWFLVIGSWSLVIGHWSLVIGHWSFDIRRSAFDIRHSTFDIRYSIFDIQPLPIWPLPLPPQNRHRTHNFPLTFPLRTGIISTMKTEKVALVTGSSRGIGRGIAIELAKAGFELVVNYASNAAAATETRREIEKVGRRAITVQADIARTPDRQRLLDETLASFGRLDLLVNNAAIAPMERRDLLEATEESFDQVITTNLKGPYFLSQSAARQMLDLQQAGIIDSGKIVFITSISAFTASTNRGEYCVSKAGLSMAARLFAARLAAHNIQVFEIQPGIIDTDMTSAVRDKYDHLIHETGLLPLARWGTPEDVGKAVAAIASDYFPYSTGTVLQVDGGFHIRRL